MTSSCGCWSRLQLLHRLRVRVRFRLQFWLRYRFRFHPASVLLFVFCCPGGTGSPVFGPSFAVDSFCFSPVPVGAPAARSARYRFGPLLYRFVLLDRLIRSNFLLTLLGFSFSVFNSLFLLNFKIKSLNIII